MTISYDGNDFYGYQKQPNKRTVQGVLEDAISKVNSNVSVSIHASGRTDAGVHAMNQRAHFDIDKELDCDKLCNSINSLLPADVYVKSISVVSDDFHSRFSATGKEYVYYINMGEYNPLERKYVYQYNKKLDVVEMQRAMKYLEGTHSFKSFTKADGEYEDYVGIALPLKVLAPTILIVSMLGVFRGFYQGQGTTIPTALSQLMEQVVNAIVSIAAGYILIHSFKDSSNAAGYGAAGGTMGTAFGALTALVILVAIYMIYRPVFNRKIRKDTRSIDEETSEILKVIIVTMIPIIIGQTFYQISAVIDDIMFGKMMRLAGYTSKEITVMLGNYSSSYTMLTGVVMGIASAMSASMLPSIVASKARGEYEEINEKISATVKTNMLVAIPAFMGLVVLGEPVVELLFRKYDSTQGGMMLIIGGIAVVFYTMSTVTSSALQGIDKMDVPVYHSCISLAIHVVLLFMLLRFTNLGIYAVVIGTTTFPIVIMILNLLSLNKYIGYTQEVLKTFIIPSVCGIVMSVCVVLVYNLLIFLTNRNIIAIFFALIVAAASYFGLLLILKKKRIY